MNDLEVAQQIRDGLLPSPHKFANFTYFALRMTGTGLSYRSAHEEFVWRDPSLYLNETFLQRCYAVPVIWEHPEKSLDSKEFSNRIIGTIALPYIVDDSVWAICRIYDEEAVGLMTDHQLSTSPAVVFQPTDGNTTQEVEGLTILVEGTPSLICHLAVCNLGVWDKTGPPEGVQNDLIPEKSDSVKEPTMADETEAEKKSREDAARRDAEGSNIKMVLDAVAAMGDSIGKRMDAIEKDVKDRRDSEEKARKDADEAAMMDARARRDAEREEWMKEDAAACERDDAEEEKEAKEHEAKGEGKEKAADKARRDRRDRMDKRRKDAERAEQDKKDAERRDAAARGDTDASIAKAVADALAKHTRSDTDAAAIASEQSRADAVHVSFGTRAPMPMLGETTVDYQIRNARSFQKHSKRWKDTNLGILDAATREVVVGDIYNDAVAASKSDEHLPVGQLVPFRRTNESGHVITEFRGRDTVFKQFSAPVMAVTQFKTEKRA